MRPRLLLLPLLPLLLGSPGRAQQYSAEVETAAAKIFNSAMSPFCPGRTIATCPSYQAAELKGEIRELIASGVAPDSVEALLLARYGDVVRATPEARGFGLLAWVLPGVVLLVAGAWIGRSLVVLHRAESRPREPTGATADPLRDAGDRARLERELSQL